MEYNTVTKTYSDFGMEELDVLYDILGQQIVANSVIRIDWMQDAGPLPGGRDGRKWLSASGTGRVEVAALLEGKLYAQFVGGDNATPITRYEMEHMTVRILS